MSIRIQTLKKEGNCNFYEANIKQYFNKTTKIAIFLPFIVFYIPFISLNVLFTEFLKGNILFYYTVYCIKHTVYLVKTTKKNMIFNQYFNFFVLFFMISKLNKN